MSHLDQRFKQEVKKLIELKKNGVAYKRQLDVTSRLMGTQVHCILNMMSIRGPLSELGSLVSHNKDLLIESGVARKTAMHGVFGYLCITELGFEILTHRKENP